MIPVHSTLSPDHSAWPQCLEALDLCHQVAVKLRVSSCQVCTCVASQLARTRGLMVPHCSLHRPCNGPVRVPGGRQSGGTEQLEVWSGQLRHQKQGWLLATLPGIYWDLPSVLR